MKITVTKNGQVPRSLQVIARIDKRYCGSPPSAPTQQSMDQREEDRADNVKAHEGELALP